VAHIAQGEYEAAYLTIRETNPFPSVCARVCNHPCEEKCRAGVGTGQPIAIRALKRFIADRIDPSIYRPERFTEAKEKAPRVAVIGSGPAGLSCAHYLSLDGVKVTVYEMEDRPGGMLFSAIPAYRLPREVIQKEICSLMNANITMKYNHKLGTDFTIDSLLGEGYRAVFVALGAHKSLTMGIEGENAKGVIPSIQFLKAFNFKGKSLAKGHVGVVGGGNSAVDAARVAIRQSDVKSVTIFYRRTQDEMPAFEEEIEAATQEGVKLEILVSPVEILTTRGTLKAVRFVKNKLGPTDASGRRKPVRIQGSDFEQPLDTLIVAISEGSETDCISVASDSRIEVSASGTIRVDKDTLLTNRPGVFAGGDVVTGPNTVVDAIAAGKKAAMVIARYLRGEALRQIPEKRLPHIHVPPLEISEGELAQSPRAETPRAPAEYRRRGFDEVEKSLTEDEACREARRCLRCDLEFTQIERSVVEPTTIEVNA
jgi:NADH-quinone oxidoreductase subunit F